MPEPRSYILLDAVKPPLRCVDVQDGRRDRGAELGEIRIGGSPIEASAETWLPFFVAPGAWA